MQTGAERPEVLGYLKTNLEDLANHYHALYQEPGLEKEKPTNYAEALVWYRAFLASFPQDQESPGINYQLADLLLENADFGEAAREYERTAYDYPAHERAAAAGYAAIFSHREHLKGVSPAQEPEVKRATVASSGTTTGARGAEPTSATAGSACGATISTWRRPTII